ncbi:putative peptide maturation dehydrogenase [Montanilutibacter psychrotolerans]|uniref:Putative peptide maturation dehydrogenase n=1 Tax=Montanilutibacter psychrotolerans TaxID=1327343 RepID=A0A3M8SYB1_9GAMM|nr:putative peptide maturation dehydrogenase [Lysobacter psychrotolerans]RNF83860.1 putative peptide maturation dehydrogenase [Lysobacter psychrotolerans]
MKVRRCAVVFLEPREEVSFDLNVLLSGGDGLQRDRQWLALAPHLGEEVAIDIDERELLGALSPTQWVEAETLANHPPSAIDRLLHEGLLIGDDDDHAAQRLRDERLRDTYWHPLAATLHAFTRWSEVDTVQNSKDSGTETAVAMREVLGAPPVEAARRVGDAQRLPLPRSAPNDFDRLLARRATCRNFDPLRPLPMALFAQMLQRVFAAQAEVRVSDDLVFLKKNVPSGGGLHPMECYLIVQHVEGVAPGLYHYQAGEHALEPLPAPDRPIRDFIMDMVAQQHWFADAHVLVVLSPRFDRTFWKYRHHAKGYRVVALEGGHLSQTLYLAATDAGLGAFITGAINEVQLEQAFGLDPIHQGALAICGFGWRAQVMETAELDPAGEVWAAAIPTGEGAEP